MLAADQSTLDGIWDVLWSYFGLGDLFVARNGSGPGAEYRWAIETGVGLRWGRVASELIGDVLQLGAFDPVDELDWA